jgi:hypothetical protein
VAAYAVRVFFYPESATPFILLSQAEIIGYSFAASRMSVMPHKNHYIGLKLKLMMSLTALY